MLHHLENQALQVIVLVVLLNMRTQESELSFFLITDSDTEITSTDCAINDIEIGTQNTTTDFVSSSDMPQVIAMDEVPHDDIRSYKLLGDNIDKK